MPKKTASTRRKTVRKKTSYLTKRILVRTAGNAIRKASELALKKAGYIILVRKGWLVRLDADGTTKKIKKIKVVKRPSKIVLD